MKIISGGRGSGKTYELIHLAAADPEGIYVAKDYQMARYLKNEYRGLIHPDRIVVRTDLESPYKFRGLGESFIKDIYIDDIPSGFELPSQWLNSYYYAIKAIAVQPKSSYENEYLPESFLDALHKMEKERRSQIKSLEVDKT